MTETKASWLDKFAASVSPRWALKRAADRHRLKVLAHYEGASKSRRTEGWRAESTSANTEIKAALPTLRDRSRDLIRNTGIGAKAATAVQNHVIGTGIKPSVHKDGKPDPVLDDLIQEFARSIYTDADEKLNLYGLQSLVMRTVFESGECLIERVATDSKHKGPVPLQLRILEPDYLDDGESKDKNAIQGIEFDSKGKRKGYWLFDQHPGDGDVYSQESRLVPAEDLAHVYQVLRSGQLRGVPWLAPVIVKMRDYDEYEDAHIVRQKIAASFSVFVTQNGLDGFGDDEEYDPYEIHGERVQPGRINVLNPGESVEFGNPPGVDGYADFSTITLRQIAAGIGISYEVLTGDWSKVNFSSARMGALDMHKNLDAWRDHIIFSQFLQKVGEWFLEAASLAGYDTDGAVIKWTAPTRDMLDPINEIEAAAKLIQYGLSDQQTQIRKLGRDPEDVLNNSEEWNKEVDKRGLSFHTDTRKFAQVGAAVMNHQEQIEYFRNQGKSMGISDEKYLQLLDDLEQEGNDE